MKKNLCVHGLLFILFLTALPAVAQMQPMPPAGTPSEMMAGQPRMMPGMNLDRMGEMMDLCIENAGKIGLSDAQIEKLTPLHRDMQKKQARFRADLRIAEIDLMEIMEKKDFDVDKAAAAVRKIADIKVDHHTYMLKAMKEARTILTDQQFNQLKRMKAEWMRGGKKGSRTAPARKK